MVVGCETHQKHTHVSYVLYSGYAHSFSVVYFIDTILYLNQVFVTVSLNHYEVDKVAGCCCFSLFINCILVPLKPQIKVTFQHRCHALLKIQLLSSMYWKLASTLPHWWQEVVHSRLLSHSESVLMWITVNLFSNHRCWDHTCWNPVGYRKLSIACSISHNRKSSIACSISHDRK